MPPVTPTPRSPGADGLVDEADRAHARGADLVDGLRGDLLRDPGLDLGLARGDLPLAGLQHLAVDDALDLIGLDLGALERLGDRGAAEIGGVEGARARRPSSRRGCGRWRGSRLRRHVSRRIGVGNDSDRLDSYASPPLRVEVADKPLAEVEADLLAFLLFEGDELPEPLAGAPGADDVKGGFKKTALIHPGRRRRAVVDRARRSATTSSPSGRGSRRRSPPDGPAAARGDLARARAIRLPTTPRRSPRRWSRARSSPPTSSTSSRARSPAARRRAGRGAERKRLEAVTVVGDAKLADAVEAARVTAPRPRTHARELQDLPSNVATPSYLADRAEELAERARLAHRRGPRPRAIGEEGDGRPRGRLAGHATRSRG